MISPETDGLRVRVRLCRLAPILLALALGSAAGRGQAASPADAIEAARDSIAGAELADADRQAATANLDAALAAERVADPLVERRKALIAENAARPARLAQLQSALQVDPARALEAWSRRVPADADAETLERLLDQERRTLAELQSQIDKASAALALEVSRPPQASDDIAGLRKNVEALTQPLAAVDGEAAEVTASRRLRRVSELRSAQAELDLRIAEQDSAIERQRELELEIRGLRHRMSLHQQRVEQLQARVADLVRQESEARIAHLDAQQLALKDAPGAVALAAEENRALGYELMENNEQLATERGALGSIEEERDFLAEMLRDSRTRLEVGGTTEQVGRWLWSERRRLQKPRVLRRELEATRVALADLRVRLLTLADEARGLEDVSAAARALVDASLATSAEDEAVDSAAVTAQLEPLLRERVELYAALRPLLERRVTALAASERALGEQLDATLQLQRMIDRRLLWFPSHSPLSVGWFGRVGEGLRDLVKPSRYVTTFDLCTQHARQHPLLWIGGASLLVLLVALRLRAPERIAAQADAARGVEKGSFRATLRAAAWTALAAAPAPAAAGLAGALLQQIGEPGRFSNSLGIALATMSMPWFALRLLRWEALEGGLAEVHFRWSRARRETLRRWLPVVAAVTLPTFLVAILAVTRRVDLAIDVQVRLAILFGVAPLAGIVWQVFAPGRVWTVRGGATEPSALRRAVRVSATALLMALSILPFAGYVYTAGLVWRTLMETFVVTVVIAVAMDLMARWVLIGERRLALRRLRERREAERSEADAGAPSEVAEENITLQEVSEHTSRLLRALRVTVFAIAIAALWRDVLPAIFLLDEIPVWYVTGNGADGSARVAVTLADVLLGVLALVLATGGSRNLPGIIELSLLSRTGLDAASRYAITSLLRYAIVIGGTVIGLGLLGLRWSQLQWMAAALTVGLGFGLQEIFANFVSGLILLFERPFRVGDVITVNNLTGRVTRIRTRATTLLDFDNMEIVVPNRSFITGQIVNWTLSDTITRVTVKVAVAHGADPELVRRLLQQAAEEDPRVLRDPPPSCWFTAFGAKSFDFELHAFVGVLADRLEVQNALDTRIVQLFAENGIAFP
jgi:potassium efflux system protein